MAEIARLLGESEDVIRTRLHRGRGMLRRGLEETRMFEEEYRKEMEAVGPDRGTDGAAARPWSKRDAGPGRFEDHTVGGGGLRRNGDDGGGLGPTLRDTWRNSWGALRPMRSSWSGLHRERD